jgi:hypothetical protein
VTRGLSVGVQHRAVRGTCEEPRVRGEPLQDDLLEECLVVLPRQVARDERLAEVDEHGTDVLVLELDGALAAPDSRLQLWSALV